MPTNQAISITHYKEIIRKWCMIMRSKLRRKIQRRLFLISKYGNDLFLDSRRSL
jgi:hypothetical protein